MKLFARLLAGFVGLLVGLLLAELLARVALPKPDRQVALLRMRAPDLQMDAGSDLKNPGYNAFLQRRPNSEWICDGKMPERMNNEGFRDRDFETHKSPVRIRLAALGDSFTEGWMGPREAAFPRVLERELGPSFEVLNFGLANRSPLRYLALYDQIVRKHHPDLVLVCLYRNDLAEDEALRPYVAFDARGVPSHFDFERYFRHTPRMPQTRWEKRLDRWQWRLCQWSRLFPYAAVYLTVDPEFRHRVLEAPPPTADDRLWSMTSDYLLTLNEMVEQDGARMILTVAPDLADLTEPCAFFRLTPPFAQKHHIPYFDASEFRKASDPARFYVPGDGHFSVAGHAAYGHELTTWLKVLLTPSTLPTAQPWNPPGKPPVYR